MGQDRQIRINHMKPRRSHWLLILAPPLLTILAIAAGQGIATTMMPGDIIDARLNNYFLEHIYQFLNGNAHSLWHLPFFAPYPYVLGLSDNLFGSAPIYLLARVLSQSSDTAFQVWFLIGYVANYAAAYYALRKLGISRLSSVMGSLIFAFALPTAAHAAHAQLHYRFGVPLALAFYVLFLNQKHLPYLAIAAIWTVWQFYCGIYMGFFILLFLAAITLTHLWLNHHFRNVSAVASVTELVDALRACSKASQSQLALVFVGLMAAMALLFYPYLQVTRIYEAKRSWDEIAPMLPRPQSYFLTFVSQLWSPPDTPIYTNLPMRHEHQMFPGFIPFALIASGFLIGSFRKNGSSYVLLSGSIIVVVLITLYVGGLSLWLLIYKLPLASAIRAMTRFDQVLLFPAAYLAALAIDDARSRWPGITVKLASFALIPALIFEFSAIGMVTSPKAEWQARLQRAEGSLPSNIKDDAILFFAQSQGPLYADDIDGMWIALRHGTPTLNGYSGSFMRHYSNEFGTECAELPRRVMANMIFTGQDHDPQAYFKLIRRVVPIGFRNCHEKWFHDVIPVTATRRLYTADEIRNLSYEVIQTRSEGGKQVASVRIVNRNKHAIAALSTINRSLYLSWRFLHPSGQPATNWDPRISLTRDIPANGELIMDVPIDASKEVKGGTLQISMVQEMVFWAHDIGVKPADFPWIGPVQTFD